MDSRWYQVHLRESEVTLAELLKEEGYVTCHAANGTSTANSTARINLSRTTMASTIGWPPRTMPPSHKNPKNFVLNGKELGELEGYSAPWSWRRESVG